MSKATERIEQAIRDAEYLRTQSTMPVVAGSLFVDDLKAVLSDVAECERRIAELERDRDMYRTMFNRALDCVDRVFQVDSTKPTPLLPDFLGLGECKFKGVIKLAEEYLKLKGPTP